MCQNENNCKCDLNMIKMNYGCQLSIGVGFFISWLCFCHLIVNAGRLKWFPWKFTFYCFWEIGGPGSKKYVDLKRNYFSIRFERRKPRRKIFDGSRDIVCQSLGVWRDIGIYIGESAPKMDLNCHNVIISNQIHSKLYLIQ